MSKFSFEFATLSPDMEETLKNATLPIRRAIGRNIAAATPVAMNKVQAKRLGLSSQMDATNAPMVPTADQKHWGASADERWINNVIAISRMHVLAPKQSDVL